jgi:hypothetical protein
VCVDAIGLAGHRSRDHDVRINSSEQLSKPAIKVLCGFLDSGGVVGHSKSFPFSNFAAAKWRLYGLVAHVLSLASALSIYHSSRVSIGKVKARMIAHSVFLSYCIALVNLLGRSLDE